MIDRAKIQAPWRWVAAVMLLSLCSLLAVATQSAQEEEDETRRLWNKKFEQARARTKKPGEKAKEHAQGSTPQAPDKPGMKPDSPPPSASASEATDEELIGVTIWRLREATASDDQTKPRLLTQSLQLLAERAGAGATFNKRDRVRLSIEVPREGDSYLYVIDREVYADGSFSAPYLIFPTKGTRGGDNVVTAGKVIDIPAPEDKIPFFNFTSLGEKQVGERLTIIVSPKRLDLPLSEGPLELDSKQVAQWEKQWGGPTEQRESKAGADRSWTAEEKEAGEGKRLLVQGDPLPQTIYRVAVKSSGPVVVNVPLRIAP